MIPIIYCDGASRKDRRGGWGMVVTSQSGEILHEACGGARNTTNNRMELQGAIEAAKYCMSGQEAIIYSDSQYVIHGILDHIDLWLQTGWRTSANKPVKNQDLWEELCLLDLDRKLVWTWVKGHSGVPGNERADKLAGMGVPNPLVRRR